MNIKKLICTVACLGFTTILSGCLCTSFRSMSSMPLPTPHQPRLNPESKDREINLSVNGFGITNGDWFSTANVNAGGGQVEGTIRPGGFFSPLFASASFSGFGGNVNFDCKVAKNCSDQYYAWLLSKEGQKKYSFWGTRENLRTGFEFHPPIYLFFGLSAEVQFYQGGGEFDRQRKKLRNDMRGIRNLDDGYGNLFAISTWNGFHLGKKGQYGSISLEISYSLDYIDDDSNMNYLLSTLSYYHPSGFYGGVSGFSGDDISFYGGKIFQF